mgnify:FL=1
MELKKYQQEVLSDLSTYIDYVKRHNNLGTAYRAFWERKGVSVDNTGEGYLHPYENSVPQVPKVTIKVPTAGGKTYIACNALKRIFDGLPSGKSQVVAWFVPSDTILKQTYEKLSNPNHPYRQRIDSLFNGNVRVVDKEAALFGTGISPTEIREQLTIFVLSVQSFASKTKEGRKVYRENENLTEYTALYDSLTKHVEGADDTAFIQVLSYLNPVVIIDESHNFEAPLRVEVQKDINPRFILELTATPRPKSNIISFVDAIKLKEANMVKLPVIVYNHRTKNDVLTSAINLQRSLEQKAIEQEQKGGLYIRPIVLFQAQPKTDTDSETFDKIKEKLIQIGIPEEQIKIKTAQKDEIKRTDLMSRDCPVRYIITINALKEGWDCPFAYILASLANKSSRVDVEQILGRVLRLPYTTKHGNNLLNLSYVFTSSDNFNETIQVIIKGLNKAGYSKRDFKVTEPVSPEEPEQTEDYGGLFGNISNLVSGYNPVTEDEQGGRFEEPSVLYDNAATDDTDLDVDAIRQGIADTASMDTAAMEKMAAAVSKQYDSEMEEAKSDKDNIPNDLKDMQQYYTIKSEYKEEAEAIKLPVFVKKVITSDIFDTDSSGSVPVTKKMLAEGFDLSKADRNILFTRTAAQAQMIDLSKGDEYTPKAFNLKENDLKEFRKHFTTLSTEGKQRTLAANIARALKYDEIPEKDIKDYIVDVIKGFDNEQLSELYDNELDTQERFKQHIDALLVEYEEARFKKLLDISNITCEQSYSFPKRMTYKKTAIGLRKGLYSEEDGDINNFEYEVIKEVINLDNVVFWHRNPDRTNGFGINGFINHYPDFIVGLKSGRIVMLETKGGDRDNSDSKRKLELGKLWANTAGDKYRYYMVFSTPKLNGAITTQELLETLKNL